jgi:hypothetical protein
MSTMNLPWGKERPALKADLTAICEAIVQKMWEPRRVSMACYKDSSTFTNGSMKLALTYVERR